MNIALIGSGGREHALCEKLIESRKTNKIYCIPGNAGTLNIAKNLNIDFLNFKLLHKTIKMYKINLVIVGPEEPLVKGLVDFLRKKKIRVFGPDKYASQLEGSKGFMKNLCKQNNIPTANFKICSKNSEVLEFIKISKMPLVVKADGLAAGKGVTICKSSKEVIKISSEIFSGKFKSSKKLVLEEFLEGEEVSYFVVVDKKNFTFIGSAQDHKKAREGETGPNTGGMGAYSPAPIINKSIERKIINKIIKPTLSALKKKRHPFTGFLYVGLMIKNKEPHLIEYNIRMGDPECQVIMPRLKTNILDIINASLKNNLNNLKINWSKKKCMTVVLCTKGYPGNYKKNLILGGLQKIKQSKNIKIFHAGTLIKKGKLVSAGGRVLNITSLNKDFLSARRLIYRTIKKINWKKGFYRSDIGWRVI
ncbi:phosphoribosylamine--glycine ligase [Pelagibacteraceae bacterium]|nr:phosphoribosylamine--glycine ligase [Pelagibacteraceae bacterium]|tara:strand:- start:9113 stop:10372 length:1260 start_codon:yes stop_codon:yes gene_type:complete